MTFLESLNNVPVIRDTLKTDLSLKKFKNLNNIVQKYRNYFKMYFVTLESIINSKIVKVTQIIISSLKSCVQMKLSK